MRIAYIISAVLYMIVGQGASLLSAAEKEVGTDEVSEQLDLKGPQVLKAMQGDGEALCNLGYMYQVGFGCPRNLIESYAYYNLASGHLLGKSKSGLDPLLRCLEMEHDQMTPQQIAEAQKRSLELEKMIEENIKNLEQDNSQKKLGQEKTKNQLANERAKIHVEETAKIREEERAKLLEEEKSKSIWQKIKELFN